MDYSKFNKIQKKAMENACWNKYIFWAFNDEQFIEGTKKTHARKNKRGKWLIHPIIGGGYLTEEGYMSWETWWKNWKRYEDKFSNDEKYIIDGLVHEYFNHECMYDSLCGRKEVEKMFPQATPKQKEKAWKKFWNRCVMENLF